MTKRDFEQLAVMRLEDAHVLLQNGRYNAAYYLAGYAVDCAMKACIAAKAVNQEFPARKDYREAWTHKLLELVKHAQLEDALDEECGRDREFQLNWLFVREWNETSRYEVSKGQADGLKLWQAITDPEHGVLKWTKQHW